MVYFSIIMVVYFSIIIYISKMEQTKESIENSKMPCFRFCDNATMRQFDV